MYTDPKPHCLQDYAQAPLFSRETLWFTAAAVGAVLCGGLVGLFEAQSQEAASARAPTPEAAASGGRVATNAAAEQPKQPPVRLQARY